MKGTSTLPANGDRTAKSDARVARVQADTAQAVAVITALFDGTIRILSEVHRHQAAMFGLKTSFLKENEVQVSTEADVSVHLDL